MTAWECSELICKKKEALMRQWKAAAVYSMLQLQWSLKFQQMRTSVLHTSSIFNFLSLLDQLEQMIIGNKTLLFVGFLWRFLSEWHDSGISAFVSHPYRDFGFREIWVIISHPAQFLMTMTWHSFDVLSFINSRNWGTYVKQEWYYQWFLTVILG